MKKSVAVDVVQRYVVVLMCCAMLSTAGLAGAGVTGDEVQQRQQVATFPTAFSDRHEGVVVNEGGLKYSFTTHEYYNYPLRMAALYYRFGQSRLATENQWDVILMDYNINQTFTLKPLNTSATTSFPWADTECHARAIASGQMPSMWDILELPSPGAYSYVEQGTVRGIPVDTWTASLEPDNLPSMYNTSVFSWSLHDQWTPATATNSSPVSLVYGTGADVDEISDSGSSSTRLNFYYYNPSDAYQNMRELFQIPPGVHCSGEVPQSQKPFLGSPSYFQTSVELLLPEMGRRSHFKVAYDYPLRVLRVDFAALSGGGSTGGGYEHMIQDYTSGIVYTFTGDATATSPCQLLPIKYSPYDLHMFWATPGTDHMPTPEEMFANSGFAYRYIGERPWRQVSNDVWSAQRRDWPPVGSGYVQPGENVSTLWEWYFTTPEWLEFQGPNTETSVPTSLQVYLRDSDALSEYMQSPSTLIYNFYHFYGEEPALETFSVDGCYPDVGRLYVQMTLDNPAYPLQAANPTKFQYSFIRAVTQLAGISPLRISQFRCFPHLDRPVDLVAQFVLLPAPSDDIFADYSIPEVEDVFSEWLHLSETGQLYIPVTLWGPHSVQNVTVARGSVLSATSWQELSGEQPQQQTTPTPPVTSTSQPTPDTNCSCSTGPPPTDGAVSVMSGGALAGLCVGMLFLGALLSAVALYLRSHGVRGGVPAWCLIRIRRGRGGGDTVELVDT